MALTITLQPDIEQRFREEAARSGLSMDQLAAQRIMEAELLWRIRTAAPDPKTRLLHKLLRRQHSGTLTQLERHKLQTLLDEREERSAQRLQDLAQLSKLRSISVRELMSELGISPVVSP